MADAAVPPAPGPTPVAAGVVAGLVALVLASVHALVTPLMGLPDEPAHAVYAAAVVRGEVVGEDVVRTDPGSGWTRTETSLEVPAAYAGLPERPTCFAFEPDVAATCAPPVADAEGPPTTGVSTVGTYAPAWYAVVGWPSLLLAPTPALYGMRTIAAGLAALLVGIAAVAAARAGGGRWGLVGVLAALPPAAAHLGGGINPSGTEIAGAVALWATTAVLVVASPTRGDVVRWGVAAVAVGLSRPLGPAMVVGITLVAALALRGTSALRSLGTPRVRAGMAVGLVAAVASLGWSLWRGTLSAFSGFPAPELGVLGTLRRSVGLLPERLVEMVGMLGWSDVALPRLLVLAWLAVVAGLVAVAVLRGGTRLRAWLLLLALGVVVLPLAADLRSAAQIGFVWQGRYTLPVAAGLPVLAGLALGRSGVDPRAATALAAGLGAGHLVAVVASVRRFGSGSEGDLGAALTSPTDAGLSAWLLVGAAAAAAFVVAIAVTRVRGAPVGSSPTVTSVDSA